VIYVNGDSHSAGADIIPGICFAQDDPRYLAYGRRAHPEAVLQTYGYHVAQTFNQGFFCEAESGSSNARILRTTKEYINKTSNIKNIGCIVIGWTSWDREEWKHGEDYIQITASGIDSVPESMAEEYKKWTIKQTPEELKRKEQLWRDCIWNFHCELDEKNINHVFFSTNHYIKDSEKWGMWFISTPYCEWLKSKNFEPVENSNHYGADGHAAWANVIGKVLGQTYFLSTNSSLTTNTKRSIITHVKNKTIGFNR